MTIKLATATIATAVERLEAAQAKLLDAYGDLDFVRHHLQVPDPMIGQLLDRLIGMANEPPHGEGAANIDRIIANLPTYMGISEIDIRRHLVINLGNYYGDGRLDYPALVDDIYDYFELPRCTNAAVTLNGITVLQIIEQTLADNGIEFESEN